MQLPMPCHITRIHKLKHGGSISAPSLYWRHAGTIRLTEAKGMGKWNLYSKGNHCT